MYFQSEAMRYLKKKLILIIKDQRGSYVISFTFIFLIIFMMIAVFLQVGTMMIKNTEMQTAADSATLAGLSTLKTELVQQEAEVQEQDGEITEVKLKDQWKIVADQNSADAEAKQAYTFNTNLNGAVFTGDLGVVNDVNHIYSYHADVKDYTPPFMFLKSMFKNHSGPYFHIQSSAKARVILPDPPEEEPETETQEP